MSQQGNKFEEINFTCMGCSKECSIWEEVSTSWCGGDFEIWCYCEKCDIETFHPIKYIN